MEVASPSILLTIVSFIGGFSVLVFIHEWGHYIVGRIFGVKAEVFSIGFGPELIGYTDKKTGTRWCLSAIPLGGYVKFIGDANAASSPDGEVENLSEADKQACLHFKPLWQRSLVVLAGPVINLILPVFIFAAFSYGYGSVERTPQINVVQAGTAAEKAGLKAGDTILEIDGSTITRFRDVGAHVVLHPGMPLDFKIQRADGSVEDMVITPGTNYKVDRFDRRHAFGFLGVGPGQGVVIDHTVFSAIGEGYSMTVSTISSMLTGMKQLVLGMRSIKEMSGPVGIATMAGEAASQGIENLIYFFAFISLSLGIMNLMPIPVLDGGHLLFYALEAIRGKPLNATAQNAGAFVGLSLVMILMVVVTFNDVNSLVP